MRRVRRPQKLGDELTKLVKPLDKGGLYQTARVAGAWREIAGETITAHTGGEFLRNGELVIYVDAPVWGTELQAMSEQFRTAINEKLGEELVRVMRFSVSPKAVRNKRVEPACHRVETVSPQRPLTAEEETEIETSVSAIEDEELRAAARAAMRASLRSRQDAAGDRRRDGQ
jgi:hypothetical protein